jgi:hypothetical protein
LGQINIYCKDANTDNQIFACTGYLALGDAVFNRAVAEISPLVSALGFDLSASNQAKNSQGNSYRFFSQSIAEIFALDVRKRLLRANNYATATDYLVFACNLAGSFSAFEENN